MTTATRTAPSTATSTAPCPVSTAARARLDAAMAEALTERALRACEQVALTGDAADIAELAARDMLLEHLDERIARIRETLAEAAIAAVPPPPDVVAPQTAVVLRFDRSRRAERFVVGSIAEQDEEHDVVTPASPLGRALLGARRGDTVSYAAPLGAQRVTVLEVVPLT